MKTLLITVLIMMISLPLASTSAAETDNSVPVDNGSTKSVEKKTGRYNVVVMDIKLGDTVMLVTYYLYIGPKETDILPFSVYTTPDRLAEFRGITSADLIFLKGKEVGIKGYSRGKKIFEEKLNVPPRLEKPKLTV